MSAPKWVVKGVVPNRDFTLRVSFADGTEKIIDMRKMSDAAALSPLKNQELFMKAKVECGTVVWNDEIDIAPEWLYEA